MSPDRYLQTSASRLASLDAARGLIVVLMAIDHARAFIARNHPSEFWGTPLPDYQGDWLAFMTRLVDASLRARLHVPHGCWRVAVCGIARPHQLESVSASPDSSRYGGLVLVVMGQLLENTAAVRQRRREQVRQLRMRCRARPAPSASCLACSTARLGPGGRRAACQAATLGARC